MEPGRRTVPTEWLCGLDLPVRELHPCGIAAVSAGGHWVADAEASPRVGSRGVKLKVLLVCAAAAASTGVAVSGSGHPTRDWATFATLAIAAAAAQLFVVHTTHHQAYHLAIVFVVAAALLLPPELVALICVVQHLPEWVKERYAIEIQGFNIANYTLAGIGAWAGAHAVSPSATDRPSSQTALAGVVAGAVFVLVNHGVLAGMLRSARGHSVRETGLFSVESLSTDLVLGLIGVGLASWWHQNLWLAPVAVAPLVLIHRALSIPRLRAEASLDAKTGLYNAGHLNATLSEEMERAARFGRPLSVVVADLDLLRKINNTYGHLTGDVVIRGVADTLRQELRPYDLAARFGGEEFAIVLPETEFEEALAIAERVRASFAEGLFRCHGSEESLHTTLSLGVASFPVHATDTDELVHQADLALYRAKALGRNRVCGASAETLVLNRLLGGEGSDPDIPRGFRPYGPDRSPADAGGRLSDRFSSLRSRFAALRPRALLTLSARRLRHTHFPIEEVRRANVELRRSNAALAEWNQRVRRTHLATIAALSRSMEAKNNYEGSHTERVAALAVALAARLGFRGDELDAIEIGALLHDIGKIGIPEAVLHKSGALTEDEWRVMREHPVISDYILSEVDLHPFVRQIARWSHERIDGRGYPDGLSDEDIPLPARIALVADAFDALTSDRPYRTSRTTAAALAELREHAGTQFCPLVVEALEGIAREDPQVLGDRHLRVVA